MLHKFWVVFILTVHSSLKGIIHPIHHLLTLMLFQTQRKIF